MPWSSAGRAGRGSAEANPCRLARQGVSGQVIRAPTCALGGEPRLGDLSAVLQ
jgi:hypothetical protein